MRDAIDDDELQDYVEGRLDSSRAARVRTWLAQHPERAGEVALLIAQRDALRDVGREILDEPVPSRLLGILRGGGTD